MKQPFPILIVEDNEDLAILIRKRLASENLKSDVVSTGKEAISTVIKTPNTFMLLDNSLPDTEGLDVIKTLKDKIDVVNFMTLTGRGDEKLAVEMMKLGARDYIVKDKNFLDILPSAVKKVIKDIRTKQKLEEAESSLIKSEEKYRSLFEFAHDSIFIVDPSTHMFLDVNDNACKRLGYSKDEMLNMKVDDISPPHQGITLKDLLRKLEEMGSMTIESVHKRKDGSQMDVEISTRIIQYGEKRVIESFVRDITERKRAEEAIKESEEKYRLLFSNMLDSFALHEIVVDENDKPVDYVFLEVNNAFETMTGLKRTDIIGKKVTEALPGIENDPADWIGVYGKVALEGEVVRFEQYSETLGKWYSVYAYRPQQNQFAVIFEDISDRKKAEEALRESEEKFRSAFESSKVGLNILGPDYKYQVVNKAFCDMIGYSQEELLSSHFRNITHPDDIEQNMALSKKLRAGEIDSFQMEKRYIHKNGRVVWGSLSVSAVWDAGEKLIYVIALIEDITERKRAEEAILESEEKFRMLFEDSKDAVYISSREGRYIDVNQSTLDLFGYTKKKMLKINVLKTYVNPDDREKFQKEIEGKGYVRDYEIQFQKKGGTKMDCLLTASIRKDADGSILGYQGIIRDITKEKILQQQLIQSEKLSSIGTFVSGVAHELNNPLTAVSLYSESLKEYDLPSGNAKNDLNIIIQQSRRASNIVKNLLEFSRRHKPGKSLCHINDILESVLSLQENSFRTENIEIKREFANDIPSILADSNQLQQVIMNIILNAEHEMKKARGRGTITAKTLKSGKEIVITLENDGPPIPKDKLKSIFDPFFTTKEVGEGTGLGLYIALGIVHDHGGNLRVENIGKAGVRFVITLPISDKEAKSERDDAIEIKVPRGARILYVDDEKDLRDVIARNLLAKGMFVMVASNGKEAIELLEQNQFDVVISDVKMPDMSGLDVGKWLNKNKPVLLKRFILATGAIDPEIDDFCRQYGCDAITKPFDMEKLFIVIDGILGKFGETGNGK